MAIERVRASWSQVRDLSQVAQNPMQFVMLILSVGKMSLCFFFKEAEKYGQTGMKITHILLSVSKPLGF